MGSHLRNGFQELLLDSTNFTIFTRRRILYLVTNINYHRLSTAQKSSPRLDMFWEEQSKLKQCAPFRKHKHL